MLEVIIIDDDQIVIFIQKKMMVNHHIGTNPLSFKKAVKALEYLEKERNADKEFLILLDINMPGMSGWELLDHLEEHEHKGNYHIIMVTSSINKKDKLEAEKYSIVKSFIEKPISAANCDKIKELSEISHFFEKV
ncbi:Response regulator receiver domain-containing protein [Salegentibacter echinorum]|uniref:Response regulator receiver domain-containing protein n=1 Tax=Salegentibacter echinorum TaxID=1073325 RepID=A0A1M5FL60_SALEC|nr:response regulator [Salegentibacter echinorum]SHF91882.1 Response regulator receiver domain-containing protein [Salegentibacter echinorum]